MKFAAVQIGGVINDRTWAVKVATDDTSRPSVILAPIPAAIWAFRIDQEKVARVCADALNESFKDG